jgi:hypothetical protein
MAIVSSFGYTNTTASTNTVAPVAVGVSTNYTVDKGTSGKVTIKNLTSPVDQVEAITIMSRDQNWLTQVEPTAFPVKTVPFRMVTVKVEGKKRVTSTTDDTFVQDYPVTTNISFRFPVTAYVTAADLREQLLRLCEVLAINDPTAPTSRIQKLMLNQLDPTAA